MSCKSYSLAVRDQAKSTLADFSASHVRRIVDALDAFRMSPDQQGEVVRSAGQRMVWRVPSQSVSWFGGNRLISLVVSDEGGCTAVVNDIIDIDAGLDEAWLVQRAEQVLGL